MRRTPKVQLHEEEEEEEMDFDDDMEGLEGDMDGMTLEDLLTPEEIETLICLVRHVLKGDLDEVKKTIECTCYSCPRETSERLVWAGETAEKFRLFSHVSLALPSPNWLVLAPCLVLIRSVLYYACGNTC